MRKHNKKDDPTWTRVAAQREDFFNRLKIAIDVAGGRTDVEGYWETMPLDEVFTHLYPNGIIISFEISEAFPRPEQFIQKIRQYEQRQQKKKKGES